MRKIENNKLREEIKSIILKIPSKYLEGYKENRRPSIEQITELIKSNEYLSKFIKEFKLDEQKFSRSIDCLFETVIYCIKREFHINYDSINSLECEVKSLDDSKISIIDSIVDDYINVLINRKARFCKISILTGIRIDKKLAELVNYDIVLTDEITLRALPITETEEEVQEKQLEDVYYNRFPNRGTLERAKFEPGDVSYPVALIINKEIDLNNDDYIKKLFDKYSIMYNKAINIEIIALYSMRSYLSNLSIYEAKALTILRLFRVGDIRVIKSQLFKVVKNSDKDILIPLTNANYVKYKSEYKYKLMDKNDVKLLQNFWKKISDTKLFKPYPRDYEKYYLQLAYEDYLDALSSYDDIKKIMYASMGFDTLFIKDDDNSREIKSKLNTRTNGLIHLLKSLTNKKYGNYPDLVKDAYDVRNKFVHGNVSYLNEFQNFINKYGNNAIYKLLDWLRITLIISIIVENSHINGSSNNFKNNFLTFIDEIGNHDTKKIKNELKDIKELFIVEFC